MLYSYVQSLYSKHCLAVVDAGDEKHGLVIKLAERNGDLNQQSILYHVIITMI